MPRIVPRLGRWRTEIKAGGTCMAAFHAERRVLIRWRVALRVKMINVVERRSPEEVGEAW